MSKKNSRIKDKKPHQLKLASMLKSRMPSVGKKSGKHNSQEVAAIRKKERNWLKKQKRKKL